MKKKLQALALMLVAALAVTIVAPTKTARAGDDVNNPTEVDLVNDEPHELGAGGSGSSSPGGSGSQTLYHYINATGMKGIVASKQLNPSLQANNVKDARYGDGQYLSDLKPSTQTPVSLAKTFINVPNQYKYTHYVEIDVNGLDVMECREHVYLVPNSSALDLNNRIIDSGAVNKQ